MSAKLLVLSLVLLVGNCAVGLKTEKIINGLLAKENQFKYQVSLQYFGKHICGGALIADDRVITAAHCFHDRKTLKFRNTPYLVVAGTIDYHDRTHSAFVEKVYVLKSFGKVHDVIRNDIAVVQLDKKFNIKLPNIGVIKLAKKNKYLGKELIVAGFGWNEINFDCKSQGWTGSSTGRLHYETVDVEPCEIDDPTFLCGRIMNNSQATSYGTCKGDSGSPLTTINGKIIGIVSQNHISCDQTYGPTYYIKVSKFTSFIENAKSGTPGSDTDTYSIDFKVYDIPNLGKKVYTSSSKLQTVLQYFQDNHHRYLAKKLELDEIKQDVKMLELELAAVRAKYQTKKQEFEPFDREINEEFNKLHTLVKNEKFHYYVE